MSKSKLKSIQPVVEEEEDLLNVQSAGSDDEEEDEGQHSKLLDAITKLGGKRKYLSEIYLHNTQTR